MNCADSIRSYTMRHRSVGAFFALNKPPSARLLPILLLAFVMAGCATQTADTGRIEMLPRDSDTVSRGVVRNAFPGTTTILVTIDRRIFMGHSERTAPNETFGFAVAYGQNRRTGGSARTDGRNDYYKAILSSTDNHVLRCDLTYDESKQRDGLCVDDFGRVYDIVSNR